MDIPKYFSGNKDAEAQLSLGKKKTTLNSTESFQQEMGNQYFRRHALMNRTKRENIFQMHFIKII